MNNNGLNDVVDFINVNRDRYLTELKDYLAIPSISALPQHASDVRRCAEWTADELRRVGLQNVKPDRDAWQSGGLRGLAWRGGCSNHPFLRRTTTCSLWTRSTSGKRHHSRRQFATVKSTRVAQRTTKGRFSCTSRRSRRI